MSDNLLEELKETDPLAYHIRCFETQKNTTFNILNSLGSKKSMARVLTALMIHPLSDFKQDAEGNPILDKEGKPIQKLGLVSQQEKVLFDFCLKMLDHKANILKLGTEYIINKGEQDVSEVD